MAEPIGAAAGGAPHQCNRWARSVITDSPSQNPNHRRSVRDRHAHVADADRVASRHADIARRRAAVLLQSRTDFSSVFGF
jgi:hypothetical protein